MHRSLTALAAASVLALGAAACGDDESGSSGSGGEATAATKSASPKPAAQIDQLTGRTTQVMLDAAFVEALGTLKLTPAPVGDGKISKKGVATFPITGGNVTYYKPGSVSPFVQGRIDHDGSGLSLTGGGKTVELTDFVVDPGASMLTGTVTVDGKEAAADAPLFFLDGSTLEPLAVNEGNGTAVLEGTTVKLTKDAAALLNDTFGVDALAGGLVIGIAKITVNV
jgi:hypothetical protein